MRDITKAQRDIIEGFKERRAAIIDKRNELNGLNSVSVLLWSPRNGKSVTINKNTEFFSLDDMNFAKRYIKSRLEYESMKNEIELDMYMTLIGYDKNERNKILSETM